MIPQPRRIHGGSTEDPRRVFGGDKSWTCDVAAIASRLQTRARRTPISARDSRHVGAACGKPSNNTHARGYDEPRIVMVKTDSLLGTEDSRVALITRRRRDRRVTRVLSLDTGTLRGENLSPTIPEILSIIRRRAPASAMSFSTFPSFCLLFWRWSRVSSTLGY